MASAWSQSEKALSSKRPNIILVMTDDMGYSDVGCFGGEIATPNLDALATQGVRFTQFYNTGRCCPTRASLLTGLYPHQAGVGHMVDGVGPASGIAAYRGELSHRAVTIAEALQASHYRTYMAGKWHVTKNEAQAQHVDKSNWPCQRGFDRFYGTIHGAGSFFDPNSLVRGNQLISPYHDPEYAPTEYYYTDAITDHAVRYIDEHAKQHPDAPFFMYVAYTAAHWPMQAKEKDIAKYQGKYAQGYAPIRDARIAKMKSLGLISSQWKLSELVGDWKSEKDREWEQKCMEVYAAMVDCMDQGIGKISQSLRQHDMFDNTLVLYLQDNGGCAETLGRMKAGTARAPEPTLPPLAASYLQPDMIPKQTRDGYPVRQGKGVMPGGSDTYVAYGKNWANVSNTPFRFYKHWQHEGGISTPLIVHWPAGIAKERLGKLEAQPGHLIDLLPTCLDAAKTPYPNTRKDHAIQPTEGISLLPAFHGQSLDRAQPIFWEHEGNRAVRSGKWKLVAEHEKPWELYDIENDRCEMTNLASQNPETVQSLKDQWVSWAKRAGVANWPLPDPKK